MQRSLIRSTTKFMTGFKGIVLLVAVVLVSTGVAWAGYRDASFAVRISGAASGGSLAYAYGTMAGTRNTGDTTAQIGCSLEGRDGYAGTNGMRVFCGATDATGRSLYCSSSNASLAQSLSALSDDGYILFYVDEKGKCVSLTAASYSNYQVKTF